MGGDIDIVIISISAYLDNKNDGRDEWIQKERTLDVTGKGFIAIADIAFQHFMERNHGHLVGISSTSGLWGCASGPEYSGVKAMVSTYLEGKRNQLVRNGYDVNVTDIIPGFVAVEHSPLGEDPEAYWEITTQEAGQAI